MSEVTNENIATVTGALEEYFQRIVQTAQFNLQDFFNFMEPKFIEAGYRATPARTGGNILIIHDAGVGDFILQSGAIREIRRLYPDAHITLVVVANSVALAEFCPYVDEVIVNPKQYLRGDFVGMYRQNVELARILLQTKFDVCYIFACWFEAYLLMYMSGARTRVTVSTYIDDEDERRYLTQQLMPCSHLIKLATHIVPRDRRTMHRVDLNFALIDHTLHMPVKNRRLEVWYTPLDKSVAQSILKDAAGPIYALCMGGSHPRKIYPPEKYAKVLEMIFAAEPDATFVIIGGGQMDLKSAEVLKNAVDAKYASKIIDLTNKTSYRQSAAILALCNMYIGSDTGTMHLAEAVKCPVIEVNAYPADLKIPDGDNPKVFYPYGVPSVLVQPAHALPECAKNPNSAYGCTVVHEAHCIAQITPKKIFEAFKLLKGRIAEKNTEPLYLH